MEVRIDGTVLNELAWNIQGLLWRKKTATPRGNNSIVPNRDGRIFVPKRYDQRTLTIPMWVRGSETDGTFPAGNDARRDQLLENVDILAELFTAPESGMRTIEVDDPNLGTISAEFECIRAIDFRDRPASDLAFFNASIVLPGVWFKGTTQQQGPTTRNNNNTWNITPGGHTAIRDSLFTLTATGGACTNPKITNNGLDEHYFQYTGTMTNGSVLVVDTGSFSATLDTVPVSGLMSWSGRQEMLVLDNATQQLEFNSSSGSCQVQTDYEERYW